MMQPGLKAWYNRDSVVQNGDAVAQWGDLSGNAVHLVPVQNAPTAGTGVIFDGVSQALQSVQKVELINRSAPAYVFMVASVAANGTLLQWSTEGGLLNNGHDSGAIKVQGGNLVTRGVDTIEHGPLTLNTRQVIGIQYNGLGYKNKGNWVATINGAPVTTGAAVPGLINRPFRSLVLGAQKTVGPVFSDFSASELFEIMVYSGVELSSGEIQEITDYLTLKWGV